MRRRLIALAAVLALVLAACAAGDHDSSGDRPTSQPAEFTDAGDGGSDGGSSEDSGTDAASGDDGGDAAAPEDDADLAGVGDTDELLDRAVQATTPEGESPPPGPPDIQTFTFGRDIIFTGDLVLSSDDVQGTGERAAVAIEGLGGVVFGQNSQSDPEPRSTITFKVPPSNFQAALLRLGELGTVENQTVTAEDVTDRVVDLESRINTAEASVERLRGFLAAATDLETITRLEAQLLERETVLEQLRGQVRTLENRVALATIVLTVQQAAPPEPAPGFDVAVTAFAGHDQGAGCPGDDDLALAENEALTVCWSIANTGDVHLGEFVVADDALGVDMAAVVAVDGDLERPLAPGETLVLAWETDADRDMAVDTRVRAVPVSEDGQRLGLGARNQAVTATLSVEADDSLPGFTDSLAASADVLAFVGSVLILLVGALVPLLPLLAGAGLVAWWVRRRRAEV